MVEREGYAKKHHYCNHSGSGKEESTAVMCTKLEHM